MQALSLDEKSQLIDLLTEGFSLPELKKLCFLLGIDQDNLDSNKKANLIIDLVSYLERRQRIPELIALCKEERPKLDWPNIQLKLAKKFVPEYLWYLPNRVDQKKKLRKAIRMYEKTATHRPLLCMIHGDEQEAHFEFKDCFVEEVLPSVAEPYRNNTSNSNGIRQIEFSINFENIAKLHENILEELMKEVFGDEDLDDCPEVLKTRIANQLVAEKRPVIFSFTIYTKYCQPQHDIIKQGFIDFWADWPDPKKNKRHYRLLVFLLFHYHKQEKTGWGLKGLTRLFNKPSPIERFSQELCQLEDTDFSSCLQKFSVGTIVLPQLSPIEEKHAILWLDNICAKSNEDFMTPKHIKAAKTEIENFYKNHPKGVAMETLAKELEAILKQVTGIA